MNEYGTTTFIITAAAGCLGALAVIPYSLEIASLRPGAESMQAIPLLPQILQGVLMAVMVSGLGLLAAKAVELPVWSPRTVLLAAALAGTASAVVILGMEFLYFLPRLPSEFTGTEHHIAIWKRLLVTLYGGITEELIMRLCIMSGIVWLLRFVWHTPQGAPSTGVYWAAIILVAVLFGLGHLPATRMITPLTPLVITRAIILNGAAGILFGWLFWKHGLLAAITAHFSADIILHVIAPLLTGKS